MTTTSPMMTSRWNREFESYSYPPTLHRSKASRGRFIKQERLERESAFHLARHRIALSRKASPSTRKDEVNRLGRVTAEEGSTSPQARGRHIFSLSRREKKSTPDTENRFRRFTKADSPWSVCRTVSFHTGGQPDLFSSPPAFSSQPCLSSLPMHTYVPFPREGKEKESVKRDISPDIVNYTRVAQVKLKRGEIALILFLFRK